MSITLARIKVLASSVVTWIVTGSTLLAVYSPQIAALLPAGAAATWGSISLKVAAILGGAISIVRRVEQVDPALRGILPAVPAPTSTPATATPGAGVGPLTAPPAG